MMNMCSGCAQQGERLCRGCAQKMERERDAALDVQTAAEYAVLELKSEAAVRDRALAEARGDAKRADERAEKAEHLLCELLANIHGDGGHHTSNVGLEQSIRDAHEKLTRLTVRAEKAERDRDEARSDLTWSQARGTDELPSVDPATGEVRTYTDEEIRAYLRQQRRYERERADDAEAANAVMGDALEAFTPVNRPTLCGGCGCVYFTCSFCGQLVAISKSAHSAKADCSGHQVVDHTAKCPVRLRREALASRIPAAARYQEIVRAAEAGAKACQESFKAPPEDQPCCGMCIWRATCEAVRAKVDAPEQQECPDCEGRGVWYPECHGAIHLPCKRCGGTGKIAKAVRAKETT